MNPLANSAGNILINGALLPELWQRTADPDRPSPCPVTQQSFAASRWKVRYAAPTGGEVTQARCADVPPGSSVSCSLSMRAAGAVTEQVFFGQRVEAAEASQSRCELTFSAWVFVEGNGDADLEMHAGFPKEADIFGGCCGEKLQGKTIRCAKVSRGSWTRVRFPLDTRRFAPTGLSVELAFPPALLAGGVRIADLELAASESSAPARRPAAIEVALAERFFQRHDSRRVNSLGRALVVNAHELHFQFTFPEMRVTPACTLPNSEEGIRVFNLEGIPQTGFRYDVTYGARSSAIIRATRENHGLSDGFLSFVGRSAAIFLDAEL